MVGIPIQISNARGLYRHRDHRRKEYERNGQKISSTEPKPIQRGGGQICPTVIQKVAARVSDDDDGFQVQDDPPYQVRVHFVEITKTNDATDLASKDEDEIIRFWNKKRNWKEKNEEKNIQKGRRYIEFQSFRRRRKIARHFF